MKKFLCALLALGMTLGMAFTAACGGDDNNGNTSSTDSSSEISSVEASSSEEVSSEEVSSEGVSSEEVSSEEVSSEEVSSEEVSSEEVSSEEESSEELGGEEETPLGALENPHPCYYWTEEETGEMSEMMHVPTVKANSSDYYIILRSSDRVICIKQANVTVVYEGNSYSAKDGDIEIQSLGESGNMFYAAIVQIINDTDADIDIIMTFKDATVEDGGSEEESSEEVNSEEISSEEVSSEEVSSEEASSEEVSSEEASSEEEEGEEVFIPDEVSTTQVEDYFANKIGTVTYNAGRDLFIESISTDAPIYLGSYYSDNVFTIDGGPDSERTLTILGQGGGVIQANGGILVLKNLTIYNDTHAFDLNNYRPHYAEFGGKLRFENCKLVNPIQLRNDAEAEFINCEITSGEEDLYGVWVADGSARFDNCTFTGYRALKVHEIAGMDVENVSVENCFFEYLSTKPAIAIDIAEEVSTTTITFINCDIYACAPYKKVENVEGVDGFYERVIPANEIPDTFTFTATDCWLDGMMFEFSDGTLTWIEEE